MEQIGVQCPKKHEKIGGLISQKSGKIEDQSRQTEGKRSTCSVALPQGYQTGPGHDLAGIARS